MSVCIVAEYPWKAIKDVIAPERPGVIICCDTRAVRGGRPISHLARKCRPIGRNIVVCYTSNNLGATTEAINSILNKADVRRLGESLRKHHEKFGNYTELLAVTWRDQNSPQILEVMPPLYVPKPTSGIVGIGDRAVLDHFASTFKDKPDLSSKVPYTPQHAEDLFKSFNVKYKPWSIYPLDEAAVAIAGEFSLAVEVAGGPYVGLPFVMWTVRNRKITEWNQAYSYSPKTDAWTPIGLNGRDMGVPPGPPPKGQQERVKSSAVRLFE
jgi:hypothetical protein